MKINLYPNFNNPKKFKRIAIILSVVLVILVLLLLIFEGNKNDEDQWLANKSQNPEEIKDITKALPYSEGDYRISYSEENDLFIVSYPGYIPQDQVELWTILWFKANTALKNIRVKYGELKGETIEYDLNISSSEILRNNEYYQNSVKNSDYSNM